MGNRRIFYTADGSTSLHVDGLNEQYHSKHGAIREAQHVFVKSGFNYLNQDSYEILEMGLGTGLNVLLTYLAAKAKNAEVRYTALEKYPLENSEVLALNYDEMLNEVESKSVLERIHLLPWGSAQHITDSFQLTKLKMDFRDFQADDMFNLIYFDAFGPEVQPQLWSEEVLGSMYASLKPCGVLVTYSAKGIIRRRLEKTGFLVERLAGPPGKRHMVRAVKK